MKMQTAGGRYLPWIPTNSSSHSGDYEWYHAAELPDYIPDDGTVTCTGVRNLQTGFG
jgi:hypothetical protein